MIFVGVISCYAIRLGEPHHRCIVF